MGYSESPEVVHASLSLLERIVTSLREEKELVMKMDPRFISRQVFRINRALASAQLFSSLYDGKYAALREQVNVRVNRKEGEIHIIPKAGVVPFDSLSDERKTDFDVLNWLARKRPERLAVTFRWTTLSEGEFELALNKGGYEIVTIRGDEKEASALLARTSSAAISEESGLELDSVPVTADLEDILSDFNFD